MEITDFGLNDLEVEGLQLVVYENNERYCAKDLALVPYQTCPEHRHPHRGNDLGKMETFRCRYGTVYLFVEGNQQDDIHVNIPKKNKPWYTSKKEIILHPGEQYTILPDTLHWFQAGKEGAIISEFSSNSDDSSDIFTNPDVKRL